MFFTPNHINAKESFLGKLLTPHTLDSQAWWQIHWWALFWNNPSLRPLSLLFSYTPQLPYTPLGNSLHSVGCFASLCCFSFTLFSAESPTSRSLGKWTFFLPSPEAWVYSPPYFLSQTQSKSETNREQRGTSSFIRFICFLNVRFTYIKNGKNTYRTKVGSESLEIRNYY